jgi:hypothetical protein
MWHFRCVHCVQTGVVKINNVCIALVDVSIAVECSRMLAGVSSVKLTIAWVHISL